MSEEDRAMGDMEISEEGPGDVIEGGMEAERLEADFRCFFFFRLGSIDKPGSGSSLSSTSPSQTTTSPASDPIISFAKTR